MDRNDITLAYGMTAPVARMVAAANNDNDDTCVYAVVRRTDGQYVIGVCEAADGFPRLALTENCAMRSTYKHKGRVYVTRVFKTLNGVNGFRSKHDGWCYLGEDQQGFHITHEGLSSPKGAERQAVHAMEILVDGVSKKAWPSLFEILRRRQDALKACLAAYGERDA